MDYEKLYKEALERARKINSGEGVAAPPDWTTCETIFPELRESEDEKIRKALIKYLDALDDDEIRYGVSFKDMRTWLEKQGEQKPEWSDKDEKILNSLISSLVRIGASTRTDSTSINYTFSKEIDWLKSIKPNHWKPSKQNIKDLEWCADLVKDKMGIGFHRLQVFIDDLKNL